MHYSGGMSYVPVHPPYPHQVEARDKMRSMPEFALLMGTRTGKTKVLVDDWAERLEQGGPPDLLALAPAGALYGEDAWETQFQEHLPPELRERALCSVYRAGMGQEARRRLGTFLASRDPRRPRILLANVEALSTVAASRELCREFLITNRGAEVLVGESTCIKGNSERTEQVQRLGALAQVRRIESGLVAPQSPLDLFWQFYFLNWKILGQSSYWGFQARYAITKKMKFGAMRKTRTGAMVPVGTTVVVGYRHEDELRDRIAPYCYRKELRDCYDAPPATYRFRDVEMTPEQARIYRELKRNATAQLDGMSHVTATAAMTRIQRLHQVVCGFVVDDETKIIRDLPERRTAALLGLLTECSGKAVVWCSYDHNIRRLRERLRKEFGEGSVAAFWGGNLGERLEEERRFKGDPACRWMLATAGAGGKGREWSLADLQVYFSNDPNLEHRHQSEARVEAYGKFDPVTRVDIRVPGTVDDRMIRCLRDKIDMASTLQGDGYKDWLV